MAARSRHQALSLLFLALSKAKRRNAVYIGCHAPRTKRPEAPANVIGNAVKVMRIATDEEADDVVDDGKDPAAKALGSKGGRACADALSSRKAEIAKKAAAAKWKRG